MFLLFPCLHCLHVGFYSIYIPICFYYFSKAAIYDQLTSEQFTFQYVSIISVTEHKYKNAYVNLHSNMFLLFQRSRPDSISGEINLHSNMFLLFPTRWVRFPYTLLHLHSNMFLLFQKIKLKDWDNAYIYIPICFYYFDPKNGSK